MVALRRCQRLAFTLSYFRRLLLYLRTPLLQSMIATLDRFAIAGVGFSSLRS
jgi:hypothetical protein